MADVRNSAHQVRGVGFWRNADTGSYDAKCTCGAVFSDPDHDAAGEQLSFHLRREQATARSQPGYELTRCGADGCGHLSTLHAVAASGARSACSASTCSCRRFTAGAA
jgi:hypothetical protein